KPAPTTTPINAMEIANARFIMRRFLAFSHAPGKKKCAHLCGALARVDLRFVTCVFKPRYFSFMPIIQTIF
ncbi:MAG: hypothetical protein E6689_02680, partial [Corynebacterium striatum]|nr:hypothetical protein [Corynebacterium striatum]